MQDARCCPYRRRPLLRSRAGRLVRQLIGEFRATPRRPRRSIPGLAEVAVALPSESTDA